MVVPPTALEDVRKELRRRRISISKTSVFAPVDIPDRLISDAKCIGLYLPMGGEPDPFSLARNFAGVTSLPALPDNGGTMTFRSWTVGDPLMAASWGGQQPLATAEAVVPDLIFVPMLGFDAAFNRIGQGGGHYDRYLAAHPAACRIGITWEGQRVDQLEPQPWDIPLDAIVTERAFHIKDLSRCQRL